MKKILLAIFLCGLQFVCAQENQKRVFNFGPMVRLYGGIPFHSGDNYLADANKSNGTFGVNLSPFEVYGFRPYLGVAHAFYKTDDIDMAASVNATRNTSIYGLLSYKIPVVESFSVEPYIGLGWSGLTYKRAQNDGLFDNYDVDRTEGAEMRAGVYLDYKVASAVSLFAGVGYVRGSYDVNTVREYKDYFEKSQSMQVSLGLKIGYTMQDKRNARAAKQAEIAK